MAANPARGELYLFGGLDPQDPSGVEPLWIHRQGRWRQAAAASGPRNRSLPGGAFDSKRGVFVVFGGINGRGGTRYGDLWEWNGQSWKEILAPSTQGAEWPGPHDHHAMAFDSARGCIVLHGGSVIVGSGEHWYTETWEFNGQVWRMFAATDSGPGTRAHHAMVYDPVRKLTVLFGGMSRDRRHLPETWGWDGATWRKLADSGPSPRARHRLAFHSASGEVVLYGGNVPQSTPGFKFIGDTWTWNGREWRERKPASRPGDRFMHAMAEDPASKRVVLYGGVFQSKTDDAWAWDGTNWSPF